MTTTTIATRPSTGAFMTRNERVLDRARKGFIEAEQTAAHIKWRGQSFDCLACGEQRLRWDACCGDATEGFWCKACCV